MGKSVRNKKRLAQHQNEMAIKERAAKQASRAPPLQQTGPSSTQQAQQSQPAFVLCGKGGRKQPDYRRPNYDASKNNRE
jgi:hypothetical protein